MAIKIIEESTNADDLLVLINTQLENTDLTIKFEDSEKLTGGRYWYSLTNKNYCIIRLEVDTEEERLMALCFLHGYATSLNDYQYENKHNPIWFQRKN